MFFLLGVANMSAIDCTRTCPQPTFPTTIPRHSYGYAGRNMKRIPGNINDQRQIRTLIESVFVRTVECSSSAGVPEANSTPYEAVVVVHQSMSWRPIQNKFYAFLANENIEVKNCAEWWLGWIDKLRAFHSTYTQLKEDRSRIFSVLVNSLEKKQVDFWNDEALGMALKTLITRKKNLLNTLIAEGRSKLGSMSTEKWEESAPFKQFITELGEDWDQLTYFASDPAHFPIDDPKFAFKLCSLTDFNGKTQSYEVNPGAIASFKIHLDDHLEIPYDIQDPKQKKSMIIPKRLRIEEMEDTIHRHLENDQYVRIKTIFTNALNNTNLKFAKKALEMEKLQNLPAQSLKESLVYLYNNFL